MRRPRRSAVTTSGGGAESARRAGRRARTARRLSGRDCCGGRGRRGAADRRDRLDLRRREAAAVLPSSRPRGSSSLVVTFSVRVVTTDASTARGGDECYVFALLNNWY